jgi:short-subunit dehydrogenase
MSLTNLRNKFSDAPLLVMFGLGVQFHESYSQLVLSVGREPDFLCDNAHDKWGKEFFGKKCISPDELIHLSKQTLVVITVRKYEQIYRQLINLGIQNVFLATFDRGYDIVGGIKKLSEELFSVRQEPFESPVKGKWTFITGASRGIGYQIAGQMAKLGSNLILHSRQIEHTKKVAETCSAFGVKIMTVAAELSSLDELEQMLQKLGNEYPCIDIIFNNAAISLPVGPDFWKITPQNYLTHYTVNAVAPIQICNYFIPKMLSRGSGRIINISSTIQKMPDGVSYACSKAALNKFIFDIAPTLSGSGVMISLVCPGYVRSDMGGINAPHSVESVVPGVLLGAVSDTDVNGRWFIAQDYAGLSLEEALLKDKFYYSREKLVYV